MLFEDNSGKMKPIPNSALGSLFELLADDVECVVLNACFSRNQAEEISRHIPWVVGMDREIGDDAALSFSVGFYQALGAGKQVHEAYRFGCVQIQLQGIAEHLTPQLVSKLATVSTS
jgi:hypothetical protein